jgi:hypothetical protein
LYIIIVMKRISKRSVTQMKDICSLEG